MPHLRGNNSALRKTFKLWDKDRKTSIPVEALKSGREWKTQCPKHPDKNPSLSINEEKRSFYCFGCDFSGSLYEPTKDPASKESDDQKGAIDFAVLAAFTEELEKKDGKQKK